jgi:phage virion morphogenesis protein
MSGVGLVYDLKAIERLEERINAIAGFDRRKLLDQIGSVVESQTRYRIVKEKTGPDGIAWPEWSERYAKTRHAGQSKLFGEGELEDSLGYAVAIDGSQVEIGSNLIYAATHQAGDEDRNIPARPYLGLSADNEEDLEAVVDSYLREVTQ